MDMFMDKLAQKLTATEMIKANTAAEVEEVNRLKQQVAEYEACLEKMKSAVDDGVSKLEATKGLDTDSIHRLVEESIEKVSALEAKPVDIDAFKDELTKQLADKFTTSEDQVHKECVKVYRNVQAVILDEGKKQGALSAEAAEAAKKASGLSKGILGVAIAALVVSLAGVALQVMQMFSVTLF